MNPWRELLGFPAWQKLLELYADELDGYRAQLMSLAQVSPDPQVRGVAAKIAAIEAVLRRPEEEAEKRGEDEA